VDWFQLALQNPLIEHCEHRNDSPVSTKGGEFEYPRTNLDIFMIYVCVYMPNITHLAEGFDQGSRVRFPVGAGNFSLHYHFQNGSGTQPVSYPVGIMRAFLG
jgi:hypothetical protein